MLALLLAATLSTCPKLPARIAPATLVVRLRTAHRQKNPAALLCLAPAVVQSGNADLHALYQTALYEHHSTTDDAFVRAFPATRAQEFVLEVWSSVQRPSDAAFYPIEALSEIAARGNRGAMHAAVIASLHSDGGPGELITDIVSEAARHEPRTILSEIEALPPDAQATLLSQSAMWSNAGPFVALRPQNRREAAIIAQVRARSHSHC